MHLWVKTEDHLKFKLMEMRLIKTQKDQICLLGGVLLKPAGAQELPLQVSQSTRIARGASELLAYLSS